MSRRSASRHSSPQRAPRRAVLGDRRWGGAGSDDDATAPRQQPTQADEAYGGGPMTNPLASDLDTESRVFSEGNHIYFFAGVSKDSIYQMKAELLVLNRRYASLADLSVPTLCLSLELQYTHTHTHTHSLTLTLSLSLSLQGSRSYSAPTRRSR